MNRIMTGLMATALSASFAAAAIVPVNAASIYVPQGQSASSDVQTVAWRGHNRGGVRYYRNHNGGNFWNGHRGYREYRHGYRRHGDFWFPLAAFGAGALITGAIANDRAPSYGSHEAYCYDRYKSYRASDNTFQPYNGPRQQCQ